jgi:large subunit ribosomal protein L4e
MNKKERALALKTAIAFTGDSNAVAWRGHRIGSLEFPLVVDDEIETVTKTAELLSFLRGAGLEEELNRLYDGVKRRSGKPRMRGRAYKERVGPLFVVNNDRGIGRAAEGIPGVKVVQANSLSILELAPAGVAGRMTFWTESALDSFKSEESGRGSSGQGGERSDAEQGGMKVEA